VIIRLVGRLALLWFLAGIVSPALVETLHAAATTDDCHSDGPCNDPGDGGKPCGPTCPCACCPGHRTVPALAVDDSHHGSPVAAQFEAAPPDTLNHEDVVSRVFHPPRA